MSHCSSFFNVSQGNGNPLQCSCLENPMDGGAWWAAVHGVAKSRTWLSDFTFSFHFPALEKEMATHSSVLAWRIPGTGEPGGLPSMGSHRVGHDWSHLAAAAAVCMLIPNSLVLPLFLGQLFSPGFAALKIIDVSEQQGYTAEHRELSPLFCNNPYWTIICKKVNQYTKTNAIL